jgi:hypothetical protein
MGHGFGTLEKFCDRISIGVDIAGTYDLVDLTNQDLADREVGKERIGNLPLFMSDFTLQHYGSYWPSP